jgi:hypothetical protein
MCFPQHGFFSQNPVTHTKWLWSQAKQSTQDTAALFGGKSGAAAAPTTSQEGYALLTPGQLQAKQKAASSASPTILGQYG